jgi:hypothetical protein
MQVKIDTTHILHNDLSKIAPFDLRTSLMIDYGRGEGTGVGPIVTEMAAAD